jgi:UDP-glucose 4-epimerase
MSKPERVLVTGGAGFIGSHFVDKIVTEGYNVRVLDNLSTGKLENLADHLKTKKVEFVSGDIRDNALIRKCLADVEIAVHFAAQTSVPFSVDHKDLTFDVNATGTQELLDACVKESVGKFVFASSCAVYGDPKCLPVNETCKTDPISPYAESKLLAEHYCFDFDKQKLLQSVVLRFFNVYGPRQPLNDYSGVITKFFDRAKRKEPLIVYGDGMQTRDFVSVHDVVDAVVACMTRVEAEGEVFNIGSGKPTRISDLAKTVLKLTGFGSKICYEKARSGDIKDSYADISKVQKLLNYKPKVNLSDGLRELL